MQPRSLLETGGGFLIMPDVQKELGLSAATKKTINDKLIALQKSMMAGSKPGERPSREDIQKRLSVATETYRALGKLLTPAQQTRLKQITVQQLGVSGMLFPEVKSQLKLNADQERKLGVIIRDGTQQMMASLQKPANGNKPTDYNAMMKEYQAKQKEWQGRMMKLAQQQLTASQKTTWKNLTGKPFTIDYASFARSQMSKH